MYKKHNIKNRNNYEITANLLLLPSDDVASEVPKKSSTYETKRVRDGKKSLKAPHQLPITPLPVHATSASKYGS